LTTLQKLTPEADGRYYHTVRSGETLSWIAGLYEIPLADLMAWNGLNNASIIRPEQKLLLLVTLPATPTATQPPTQTTVAPSPSASMTLPPPTGTPPVTETESPRGSGLGLILGLTTILIGGLLWWRFSRKS
jgi:LysM repeat protein